MRFNVAMTGSYSSKSMLFLSLPDYFFILVKHYLCYSANLLIINKLLKLTDVNN